MAKGTTSTQRNKNKQRREIVLSTIAKTVNMIAASFTILVLLAVTILVGPKLFGFNPYVVQSGSMEPLIPTGGVAYINTRDTDVGIGDVITFYTGEDTDKLVTHRIVREENGTWVTKGDANDTEDMHAVNQENVIGTYAYTIPKFGFLMAKQSKLIPFIACWVLGLNGLSMILGTLVEKRHRQ